MKFNSKSLLFYISALVFVFLILRLFPFFVRLTQLAALSLSAFWALILGLSLLVTLVYFLRKKEIKKD